jgi:hypothetical protein
MVDVNLYSAESLNDNFLNKTSSTTKWRIPPTTLKRLNDLEHDWSIRPPMLHQLPNIFLEPNRLLIDRDVSIDNWNWKDKSKSFPLVDTVSHKSPSSTVKQSNKKVKIHLDVIERLALMESTCNQQPNQVEQIQKSVDLGQEYGTEINIKEGKPMVANHRFLPKRNLDDFKIIQSCLLNNSNKQSSQEKKKVCELDNTRFRFD